jgi:hypothetical protein
MVTILVVLFLFVVLILDYLYLQVPVVKGAAQCAKCEVNSQGTGFDCKSQQKSGGQTCTVSGDGQNCQESGPCGGGVAE